MQKDTVLGHYRIVSKLGEGGMGQVFRAEDTKLRREVAIKVLPADLAGDPERIARMQREAQVLASLEHPNIAAIYGLEEAEVDGTRVSFLAMQLAEGETLGDRIQAGPIPLGEALQIALQIAQGLEAAHERGVIHRDLKPANIQLGSDGSVKLLDFGLAKSLDGRNTSSAMDLTASPTVLEATRAGVILGTAAYMSPEQARGYKVDQRTDIWAFGAVLYEMLAGRQVFGGDTATDVLGSIVHKEPEWDLLPEGVPKRIRRFLDRCLRKDPKRRLQAIGDARVAILEYLEDPRETEKFDITPVSGWQRWLPWGVAAAAVMALAVAYLTAGGDSPTGPVVRSEMTIDLEGMFPGAGGSLAVSPDGRFLAVQANVSAELASSLALRPLGSSTLTDLVVGRQRGPVFSPDSEWILYDTIDSLYKVPVAGGTPQRIVPVQNGRGQSWGPGDVIVFAPGAGSTLSKVPALGGAPEEITTLDRENAESSHRWPFVLPDGEAALFSVLTDANTSTIDVVELDGSGRKQVYGSGTDPRYLPTGHLVFADAASLFAVPFDLPRREVRGAAIPVVEGVFVDGGGRAHWDVSDNGVLVYRSGTVAIPEHPIALVSENGAQQVLWGTPATFLEPRLSPDGRKLVVCQLGGAGLDIWVYDIARQVPTRLTFDEADDCPAVWSPDGEEVIFSSAANGALDLYRKRADGSGEIERITEAADAAYYVSDWSPDGKFVILTAGSGDLLTLDLDAPEATPEPYLVTEFAEAEADFSPDGRWVAYQSNESGRNEIYVRPFPAGAGKWQISTGGGAYPRWAHDGSQVFYRTGTGLSAATVEVAGGALDIGNARPVLAGSFRGGLTGISVNNSVWADWAVAPDGRFVLFPAADAVDANASVTLQVVTNWFEELKRRVPTGR